MLAVGVFSLFYRQIGKGRGMDCLRGMPFPNLKPPVRERVKTEKGGCPALFGGLFTFARSFLSPRCCFEGSPSLRFMDTARAADVTKNGIQSIGCGGGSMDSALPPHEGSPLNSSGLSFFWLSYHPRSILFRDTVWNPSALRPLGYFLSAVSVRNASHGCPSFPSVIYRICWNSIRAPQSFPRSKGRRAIPHGGACPPLLFRRKNRRVSRDFRCPSPSAFFPAFSFAFHSAPSCQSSFFRSASVSLRGQVAVPSWEPGGVFSCPECLSAKESGNCAAVTVRHT